MKTKTVLLAAASAALSVALGVPSFAGPKDTLATVGTARVTREELELYMPKDRERTPELERAVLEEVAREFALSQVANRQGVYARPEVKLELERLRRRFAIGVLAREFLAEHPVTEEQVRRLYDRQKSAYGRYEYRMRHILVDDESIAEDLITQIKKGGDFAELAKTASKDKNGKDGGLFEWTTLGIFPLEFAIAVQSLDPGQVRGRPLRTKFGWHVIKLEGVRPSERFLPYEKAKDGLRRELEGRALSQHWDKLVAGTPIEILAAPVSAGQQRPAEPKSREASKKADSRQAPAQKARPSVAARGASK